MKDIPLSQNDLKLLVGTIARVQLAIGDSKPYLDLIERLDTFIDKPVPEEVPVKTKDKPPVVESEVVS